MQKQRGRVTARVLPGRRRHTAAKGAPSILRRRFRLTCHERQRRCLYDGDAYRHTPPLLTTHTTAHDGDASVKMPLISQVFYTAAFVTPARRQALNTPRYQARQAASGTINMSLPRQAASKEAAALSITLMPDGADDSASGQAGRSRFQRQGSGTPSGRPSRRNSAAFMPGDGQAQASRRLLLGAQRWLSR